MGKRSALSNDEKSKISNLKNNNLSISAISRITNRNRRTIKNFLDMPEKNRKIRSDKGNLRAGTKHDLRIIKRTVTEFPLLSSKAVFNNSI